MGFRRPLYHTRKSGVVIAPCEVEGCQRAVVRAVNKRCVEHTDPADAAGVQD